MKNPYLETKSEYRKLEKRMGKYVLLKPNKQYGNDGENNQWHSQGRRYTARGLKSYLEQNPELKIILDDKEVESFSNLEKTIIENKILINQPGFSKI